MKEVLTNTTAREKLTTQLIEAALEYQLDGLNIDFENLGEELGDAYIEFLRELSIQCRKNNLVLSSDNTVPRDFSAYYQRSEQAEVVDYFIIMGYDEHYVGSDPGSVASLSFEKRASSLRSRRAFRRIRSSAVCLFIRDSGRRIPAGKLAARLSV